MNRFVLSIDFAVRRGLPALLVLLMAMVAAAVNPVRSAERPLEAIAPAAVAPDPYAVEVSGRVVAVGGGLLGVLEHGGAHPVAFMTDAGTHAERNGQTVAVAALRPGDAVRLTADARNGRVAAVSGRSAAATGVGPLRQPLAVLAPLALVAAAAVLFARARRRAWCTVGQVESLRPKRSFAWPAPTRTAVPGGGSA